MILKVECKKAQPKEVMSPTGTARGRSRVMPYGMDAFMLGIGMLGELKKEKADNLSEAVHMSLMTVWRCLLFTTGNCTCVCVCL